MYVPPRELLTVAFMSPGLMYRPAQHSGGGKDAITQARQAHCIPIREGEGQKKEKQGCGARLDHAFLSVL